MTKGDKQKKGTLTLKQMEKIFRDLPPQDDWIIKWWQYPLLWALFPLFGWVSESENWKLYYVSFGSVIYLLKSKQK